MTSVVVKKGARLVIVLLMVCTATFFMLDLTPGDPALNILGKQASPAAVERVHHELGLDKPIVSRYASWLGGALHGDLGDSLTPPYGSVSSRIMQALPVTIELVVLAEVIAIGFALPLGVWAAHRQGRIADRGITLLSLVFVSIPSFLLAFVLLFLFSLHWGVLPRAEWVRLTASDGGVLENLRHALLPALSLALAEMAVFVQVLRSDVIETLREDYIRLARVKGLSTPRILLRHALRPSSFSVVTLIGVSAGTLLGSTVLVETIFGLPGLGRLLFDAVNKADYPLVQGCVLVISAIYVVVNALVDTAYSVIDPRARAASG